MRSFTENSFTDSVRKYLLDKHQVCYSGRFYYITPDDTYDDGMIPIAYSLQWLENNIDRPYVMIGDFATEAEFLNYVCSEIDKQRFWLKKVFILQRTDAEGRL